MRSLPIMFLLSVLSGIFNAPPQGRVIDQPDPFAIEFPGILGGLRKAVDGADISLPTGVRVTRFRVWLLEPYAQRIGYSGFTASLNGQSLATIKKSGSGIEGKFLDIDLTRRADLALSGAKNVIEVQAREEAREGGGGAVVYRASFVILFGGPPGGRVGGGERPAISCRSIPAAVDPSLPPADQTIPRLLIEEPSQPIEGVAAGPLRVRISGRVVDKAGDSLTLFINGREVASSLPRTDSERTSGAVTVWRPRSRPRCRLSLMSRPKSERQSARSSSRRVIAKTIGLSATFPLSDHQLLARSALVVESTPFWLVYRGMTRPSGT